MNIYNSNNKVVVQIEELENNVLDLDYVVYKYDHVGCLIQEPVLTGKIPENKKFYLSLPDGKYNIQVIDSTDQVGDIEQDFFVFYNTLPKIVCEIQKLVCKCNNCEESSLEELFKTFYSLNLFLSCTGLTEDLYSYKYLNCKLNESYTKARQHESNYGKFKFDYRNYLLESMLVFLFELHKKNIETVRELDTDLPILNSMFRIEEIRSCLYRTDIDLNYIDKIVNQTNCTCNE